MRAIDVAKWFYKNNPQPKLNSKEGNIVIQKLCYYAQAMYLAVYKEPLFEDRILAWENGPVIKDVYEIYRYSFLSLKNQENKISDKIEKILKVVNSVYGYKTAEELIESTHAEEPWKQFENVAKDKNNNPEITKENLKDYYKDLKLIYEANKDNDFENEKLEIINNCNFLYNTSNIPNIKKYRLNLKEFVKSQNVRDKSFNVVLQSNGELAIYD